MATRSWREGTLIARSADYIARTQRADGSIPWFPGGITDPWDHTEAAMALSVAGRWQAAKRAYRWLKDTQRPDGAWYAAYREHAAVDATRAETNFVAYVATGVWHHFRISGDIGFLSGMWPAVQAAIEFVLRLQAPSGEVYWALDMRRGVDRDALITGCSSIYKSLECACNIALALGHDATTWLAARERLGYCLRNRPDRFDRTWPSKSRYSMDWFYPVLTGVVRDDAARRRLASRWDEFVETDLGCRCVVDEPWVTVAETSELIMAMIGAGSIDGATRLLEWISRFGAEDGSWWTGYAFEDRVLWPEERPTWTAGAVILAVDALTRTTRAWDLFTRVHLSD